MPNSATVSFLVSVACAAAKIDAKVDIPFQVIQPCRKAGRLLVGIRGSGSPQVHCRKGYSGVQDKGVRTFQIKKFSVYLSRANGCQCFGPCRILQTFWSRIIGSRVNTPLDANGQESRLVEHEGFPRANPKLASSFIACHDSCLSRTGARNSR